MECSRDIWHYLQSSLTGRELESKPHEEGLGDECVAYSE
jgi:hypothetical protein